MAAYSKVSGPMWSKFEIPQDIMDVLDTCKFKNGQMNSSREKMETSIFRCSRAAHSTVSVGSDRNSNLLKL